MRKILFFLIISTLTSISVSANDALPKDELHALWKQRIQSILSKGKLPLIDMETSLKHEHVVRYVPEIFDTFDELGIALVAPDGYQDTKDGRKGYRWSDYIYQLSLEYPHIFISTANGGTNKNWTQKKTGGNSFINQLENEMLTGKYHHMGELEFRHYMSGHQCRGNKTHRDVFISIDGDLGDRVLSLSEKTGLPVSIHLEVENEELVKLDRALTKHPRAKVIVAHFGQKRHPYKQTDFTPYYVKSLLNKHSNLYFDLANGHPNREYICSGESLNETLIGDNSLWESNTGSQSDNLSPDWENILETFSTRFVFASDYGGGRPELSGYLEKKVNNFHIQIKNLSPEAKSNIAYKNAWKLLVGNEW